jgi:hypothetical protein
VSPNEKFLFTRLLTKQQQILQAPENPYDFFAQASSHSCTINPVTLPLS